MNSNRALAQISSGWIQAYAEDAQERLDMILHAYAIAEHLPPCRTTLPDSAGRTSRATTLPEGRSPDLPVPECAFLREAKSYIDPLRSN